MSSTIMEFRVREEMAGAVLKEVAALEPAERLQEASYFTHITSQVVQSLEELWGNLREPLESGVSTSDAAAVGRILTRAANFIGSSLELLVEKNPTLERFREANAPRVQQIKARAATLRRLVEMPPPAPDAQRLHASMEQMERGEGVDAADLLAEFRR